MSAVRFEKWKAFSDTFEPYREWFFTRSLPDLDVEKDYRLLEVGPDGRDDDVLGRKRVWDGCRFQIRDTDGDVVGNLEDWQAVAVFGDALPPWPVEGVALDAIRRIFRDLMPAGKQAVADVLATTAKMVEHVMKRTPESPAEPPHVVGAEPVLDFIRRSFPRRRRGKSRDELENSFVFIAREAIPDTMVQEGDVVLYRWRQSNPDSQVTGATFHRVPGAQHFAIYRHFDSLRMVHTPTGAGAERVRQRMGRSSGQKDKNSRIIVLRRLVAPTSTAIEAPNDDAALFELLAQVGGRMPPATA